MLMYLTVSNLPDHPQPDLHSIPAVHVRGGRSETHFEVKLTQITIASANIKTDPKELLPPLLNLTDSQRRSQLEMGLRRMSLSLEKWFLLAEGDEETESELQISLQLTIPHKLLTFPDPLSTRIGVGGEGVVWQAAEEVAMQSVVLEGKGK